MKNPPLSQAMGVVNLLIKFQLNDTAKLEKILQKTAKDCGYLIFLTTFAKRLKIKELWLK